MKRSLTLLGLSLLLVGLFACQTGGRGGDPEVRRERLIFAVKGQDSLSLDKYECATLPDTFVRRPVMLFAFGGGFKGGDKAEPSYIPYFEYLARNGFVVISTDYRTLLRHLDPTRVGSPRDFLVVLQQAIDASVEDVYAATRFVIDRSEEWRVDTSRVVLSGSSAGAIAVLQAEYYLCNGHPLALDFPVGFNYAGVVAYAGAIADRETPHWDRKPCPMLLFHGDADRTVPYCQAAIEGLGGLFGSASIAESLGAASTPYAFYRVSGAGHEIANLPMSRNLHDIMGFLTRQVLGEQPLVINAVESAPGDTLPAPKVFSVEEYIRANM